MVDALSQASSFFSSAVELDQQLEAQERDLVEQLRAVRAAREKLKALNGHTGQVRDITATIHGAAAVQATMVNATPQTSEEDDEAVLKQMVKDAASTPDIIKFILDRMQRPTSAKEIGTLLDDAGWNGTPELISTTLYRMKGRGELVSQGTRGSMTYSLASWKERPSK